MASNVPAHLGMPRAESSPEFRRHANRLQTLGETQPVWQKRKFQVAPGGAIAREDRSGAMYRWQKEMGAGEWANSHNVPYRISAETDSSFNGNAVTRKSSVALSWAKEDKGTSNRVALGGRATSCYENDDRSSVHAYRGHSTWGATAEDDMVHPTFRTRAQRNSRRSSLTSTRARNTVCSATTRNNRAPCPTTTILAKKAGSGSGA